MTERPLAPRLRCLSTAIVRGREVRVATTFRARLLGLAYLDLDQAGAGLLIPRCSSVHTLGMNFRLDLYFLDAHGGVIEVSRAVPRRHFAFCRGAAAVAEFPHAPPVNT